MTPQFFSHLEQRNEPDSITSWCNEINSQNKSIPEDSLLYYFNVGLAKNLKQLHKFLNKQLIDSNDVATSLAYIKIYSIARNKELGESDQSEPIHNRSEFISYEQYYGVVELPVWLQSFILRKGVGSFIKRMMSTVGVSKYSLEEFNLAQASRLPVFQDATVEAPKLVDNLVSRHSQNIPVQTFGHTTVEHFLSYTFKRS